MMRWLRRTVQDGSGAWPLMDLFACVLFVVLSANPRFTRDLQKVVIPGPQVPCTDGALSITGKALVLTLDDHGLRYQGRYLTHEDLKRLAESEAKKGTTSVVLSVSGRYRDLISAMVTLKHSGGFYSFLFPVTQKR